MHVVWYRQIEIDGIGETGMARNPEARTKGQSPGNGETPAIDVETSQQLADITSTLEHMVWQDGHPLKEGSHTYVAAKETAADSASKPLSVLFNKHGFAPDNLHTTTGRPCGFTWTLRMDKTDGEIVRYGLLHGVNQLVRIGSTGDELYVLEEGASQAKLLDALQADTGLRPHMFAARELS